MSKIESNEPTTFALDLYFAAGARGDSQLAQHVEGCARCTAYLAELAALEAPALQLPSAARGPRRRGPWSLASLAAAGAFASACAALVLWLDAREDYVGNKGLPSVQALIRSEGSARVWDGKTPIHGGDAIALRADCDRFTHVAVAVADGGKRTVWKRVFEGGCSEHEPLPFTLVADNRPGSEQIEIVFSRSTLDDAALQRAIRDRERSDTAWANTLVLPKAGAAP